MCWRQQQQVDVAPVEWCIASASADASTGMQHQDRAATGRGWQSSQPLKLYHPDKEVDQHKRVHGAVGQLQDGTHTAW